MATCKRCGSKEAGFLSDICGKCCNEIYGPKTHPGELGPDGLRQDSDQSAQPESPAVIGGQPVDWRGSATMCILLGLACMAIGAYLLIDPTVSVPGYAGIGREKVANIHMMTLGETLSIVGAIFLAAGIRPR